jgi:hypothetical protein
LGVLPSIDGVALAAVYRALLKNIIPMCLVVQKQKLSAGQRRSLKHTKYLVILLNARAARQNIAIIGVHVSGNGSGKENGF